jgi:stage II sporulation protein D
MSISVKTKGEKTPMKFCIRLVRWLIIFLILVLLFYALPPEPVSAAWDETTYVTVLTPEPETMTMGQYLLGALAAEMPAQFEPEALKAQAVAIRTYVLSSTHHTGQGLSICTDSQCCLAYDDETALQELWGSSYEQNYARLQSAVEATDGQYLTYGGQAIQAVFHASSPGQTEDSASVWSALPYLVAVSSPETVEAVPNLVSSVTVSDTELAQALGFTATGDPSQWVQGIRYTDSGRVRALLLNGQVYTGAAVRTALGLKSTAFSLVWTEDGFVFLVAGSGHGVGLSQQGANLLADQGLSYEAILAHYYTGTTLETLT